MKARASPATPLGHGENGGTGRDPSQSRDLDLAGFRAGRNCGRDLSTGINRKRGRFHSPESDLGCAREAGAVNGHLGHTDLLLGLESAYAIAFTGIAAIGSDSRASTTAMATTLMISSTSAPRASKCTGRAIPMRMGPRMSAPPTVVSSL